jgi:hypothetical protein
MAGKTRKDLSSAIGNLPSEIPELRRGEGVKLSTEETSSPPPPSQIAKKEEKVVPVKEEQVERIKPGYSLRKDIVKECKRIAWETDKKIYEVMEEALLSYIENYDKEHNPKSQLPEK